ncbi:MAG: hypothetical protein LBU32_28950 [Clostridiales bacterium]|jgi:hypothetical protein|nr:hypothetical protein [Clostridiales bacterium]
MPLSISVFIQNNFDWEKKLAEPPYFVKAKREDGFVLLKYDQIHSDFTLPIVRECRGIILDETDDYKPVCVPFFKFGNFGESYIPEIDWPTARVQEKVDGSLVKLWHGRNRWRVSSNGEINARNAHIHSALLPHRRRTDLHALFMEAWMKTGVSMESLNKDYTYMFELTSPHNRVVIRYEGVSIRHLGTRDNHTLRECEMDIGILKPRAFTLKTLDECIESAKSLGDSEEGYVVVDQFYNRIKVKSPRYVALNHLVQGVATCGHIVEIIKKNEQDEFLAYFPEYSEIFCEILLRLHGFSERQDAALAELLSSNFGSRKALAGAVMKTECPACLFSLIDGKEAKALDWLMSRPTEKILGYIGLADEA